MSHHQTISTRRSRQIQARQRRSVMWSVLQGKNDVLDRAGFHCDRHLEPRIRLRVRRAGVWNRSIAKPILRLGRMRNYQ